MNAHTTEIIVDGSDYFVANLDNGGIRLGAFDFCAIDLPATHSFFDLVSSVSSEDEAEAAFDTLVEEGVISLGGIA